MKQLELILVIMDPALRLTPAFHRAVELTRRAKARLRLCLIDYDPLIERTADLVSPEVMRLARKQFEQQRIDWLAAQAAPLVAEGLRVEWEMVWSQFLYEGVIARCLDLQPDLVIKDLQTGAAGKRHSLRPADRSVMRYCPAPLWLIGAGTRTLPQRILAAVDTASAAASSTALNQNVVKGALTVALYAGAQVHLAQVFPFERRTVVTSPRLRELHDSVRAGDEARFKAFCASQQVPPERGHFVQGEPPAKLATLAKRMAADLVVLGTTYKTGFDRMFLGSTSETLVDQAAFDVLLLRPDFFVDELGRHLDLAAIRRRHPASG